MRPSQPQCVPNFARFGVRKPHILGRQYIVRVIRSSARLRALVSQVYGLGDLTSIVDERLSEQSRALLGSWIPKASYLFAYPGSSRCCQRDL